VERSVDEEEREYGYTYASPNRYYIIHQILGAIDVQHGTTITVDLLEEAPKGLVRTMVTSLGLGVVLHQRKKITLHASSVNIQGRAVAFIGSKGQGKSTMASALYKRGNCLVSDDVIAVDFDDYGSPCVWPAFGQLKLWPDSIDKSLDENPDTLERIYDSAEKRVRKLDNFDVSGCIRLDSIFALRWGDSIQIDKASAQASFQSILCHSYTKRILGQTSSEEWHLERVSRLVSRIPLYILQRPPDLALLPEISQRIENQVLGSVT
jgi:hypothetical protein